MNCRCLKDKKIEVVCKVKSDADTQLHLNAHHFLYDPNVIIFADSQFKGYAKGNKVTNRQATGYSVSLCCSSAI